VTIVAALSYKRGAQSLFQSCIADTTCRLVDSNYYGNPLNQTPVFALCTRLTHFVKISVLLRLHLMAIINFMAVKLFYTVSKLIN
jgi:hypothetical protein